MTFAEHGKILIYRVVCPLATLSLGVLLQMRANLLMFEQAVLALTWRLEDQGT